jgi:hypothetical protein
MPGKRSVELATRRPLLLRLLKPQRSLSQRCVFVVVRDNSGRCTGADQCVRTLTVRNEHKTKAARPSARTSPIIVSQQSGNLAVQYTEMHSPSDDHFKLLLSLQSHRCNNTEYGVRVPWLIPAICGGEQYSEQYVMCCRQWQAQQPNAQPLATLLAVLLRTLKRTHSPKVLLMRLRSRGRGPWPIVLHARREQRPVTSAPLHCTLTCWPLPKPPLRQTSVHTVCLPRR